MDSRRWPLGRANRASVVEYADDNVCLLVMLACGVDADDRMVRRYAGCLTDTNTALYRLTVSSASGTVTLSAEAMEERVRDQLERGELTMGEIRADYARYCE